MRVLLRAVARISCMEVGLTFHHPNQINSQAMQLSMKRDPSILVASISNHWLRTTILNTLLVVVSLDRPWSTQARGTSTITRGRNMKHHLGSLRGRFCRRSKTPPNFKARVLPRRWQTLHRHHEKSQGEQCHHKLIFKALVLLNLYWAKLNRHVANAL